MANEQRNREENGGQNRQDQGQGQRRQGGDQGGQGGQYRDDDKNRPGQTEKERGSGQQGRKP